MFWLFAPTILLYSKNESRDMYFQLWEYLLLIYCGEHAERCCLKEIIFAWLGTLREEDVSATNMLFYKNFAQFEKLNLYENTTT